MEPHIEVEVKIRLSSVKEFDDIIKGLSAKFIDSNVEEDLYFNHPNRNFKNTGEVLRLRQDNRGRVTLTYKAIRPSAYKSKLEIEVEVNDYQAMLEILKNLGFKPVAKIVKNRRIYEIDFLGNKVHFLLDEVKGLGTFLEIEVMSKNTEEGERLLKAILSKLNLTGRIITRSYLEMMLDKNNNSKAQYYTGMM